MAAKKKSAIEEAPVVDTNVVETDNITINVDAVVEALNNVDTTIERDTEALETISEKIIEEIKPIQELKEKVNNMVNGQDEFNKQITENPDNAETIINNEIKKAKEVKKELEKIMAQTNAKVTRRSNVTNWWNGMGYDM